MTATTAAARTEAEDLTYRRLVAKVQELASAVGANAEQVAELGRDTEEYAKDLARVAEMLASVAVDPATTGECQDTAQVMTGAAEAAVTYVSATDTTAAAARAVGKRAAADHGGIQEAVDASAVSMADASFYEQD
ncbi:hypothetical protein ACIBBE_43410 [Streptomyces sp. NPDC051644]|uniref:hypothetical protein n=1 Tax=Streptomyces sp. NPDC051644 TaxID=3365666 RepID=UPI003789E00C